MEEGVTMTALTPANTAKILSSAFRRRITEEDVRQIAERGGLLSPGGTLHLVEYAVFLIQELKRDGD